MGFRVNFSDKSFTKIFLYFYVVTMATYENIDEDFQKINFLAIQNLKYFALQSLEWMFFNNNSF